MKKLLFSCFVVFLLFSVPSSAFSKEPVRIDVLYLNHGPMQPTLRDLRDLFATYGQNIALFWYDFETEKGEQFKAKMGIRRHTPMAIYIEGKSTVQVNGTPVTFRGFPTGSGPSFFQGKWKVKDLKMVLDYATNQN